MFTKILAWKEKHLTDRQMLLILAFIIGILASFAAYILHTLIHQIQAILTEGFEINSFNWLYLVFPVIGIYLTSLFVRYVVRDNISHGITRILYPQSVRILSHTTAGRL